MTVSSALLTSDGQSPGVRFQEAQGKFAATDMRGGMPPFWPLV